MSKFDYLALFRLVVNMWVTLRTIHTIHLLWGNRDGGLINKLIWMLMGISTYNFSVAVIFAYQSISGIGFSFELSVAYVVANAFELIGVDAFGRYMTRNKEPSGE